MIVAALEIPGLWQIDIEPAEDARGFFARTFCRDELQAHGIDFAVAQCSMSFNRALHTLRGMHREAPPGREMKLVRCTAGRIWDCVADLRPDSPTYRRWTAVELSARNRRALLIPPQCAHGFLTLEPNSEALYMMSSPYAPELARGIRWDDPTLAIDWPASPAVISEKDRILPCL